MGSLGDLNERVQTRIKNRRGKNQSDKLGCRNERSSNWTGGGKGKELSGGMNSSRPLTMSPCGDMGGKILEDWENLP